MRRSTSVPAEEVEIVVAEARIVRAIAAMPVTSHRALPCLIGPSFQEVTRQQQPMCHGSTRRHRHDKRLGESNLRRWPTVEIWYGLYKWERQLSRSNQKLAGS